MLWLVSELSIIERDTDGYVRLLGSLVVVAGGRGRRKETFVTRVCVDRGGADNVFFNGHGGGKTCGAEAEDHCAPAYAIGRKTGEDEMNDFFFF